jgi:putative transcriptional regulator
MTDLLLDHAAGALPEALDVLVQTHAELSPDVRHVLDTLHAGMGHGLDQAPAVPLADDALERMLGRLDAPAAPPVPAPDIDLPRALWPYAQELTWRTVVPGRVHQLQLPVWWGTTQVAVVRMRAGFRVPTHGHHGAEYNLVLDGGFTDMGEDLRAGALCARGPDHVHHVQIHDDGPCTVLVVRQGALIPHSPAAHLASWLTGF